MSMVAIDISGIELDDEGFFAHPEQWSEDMVSELARREGIDELTEALAARGYRPAALHGGMTQDQRDRVMRMVRDQAADLLIDETLRDPGSHITDVLLGRAVDGRSLGDGAIKDNELKMAEDMADTAEEMLKAAGAEDIQADAADMLTFKCEACGEEVRRIPEVGDVWLDAGIVPFSTLGWENAEWIEQGYATGAAKGLTTADLPDHAYWETWFPADWVSEMREQIRLWFYSQLFMSVALTGRAPFRKVLGYEKMLDETGREMHGSWGNTIDAPEAFARMGADVMRWQYCAQPPSQNLLFGFAHGQEIQRKLLTLWNSASFFVQYANIAGFTPDITARTVPRRAGSERPKAGCSRLRPARSISSGQRTFVTLSLEKLLSSARQGSSPSSPLRPPRMRSVCSSTCISRAPTAMSSAKA